MRTRISLGGLVMAMVVLAAGAAYAAIPGGDGTVRGCYGKLGGILRIVDENHAAFGRTLG